MATSTSVNPAIIAKAAILRGLGVKPGDGLPSWARTNATLLAGPDKPALTPSEIGNASVSGGGSNFLDLPGFYEDGLGKFASQQVGNGDSQSSTPGDYAGFNELLKSTGQSFFEANEGQMNARWLQDASGKVTSKPQVQNIDDSAFWTAAQLAGSAVTGAAGGQAGGATFGAVNAAGNTGVDTGNFSKALKQALLSLGTSYASSAATSASGLTGAAGSAVGGAVGSGVATAAQGGNLQETLKSALIGAAPGAAGATLNNNQAVSPLVATLVRQLAGTAVGRAPSKEAGSIQLLLSALKSGGK